jgi:hypothetical protein
MEEFKKREGGNFKTIRWYFGGRKNSRESGHIEFLVGTRGSLNHLPILYSN